MVWNLINRLYQYFLQLNLYKKPSSDEQTLPSELLATRIFICSLGVFILIIAATSALLIRTANKIEYSPAYTKFTQLISTHSNTLHCPCSKIGITYDTFVTTHVTFHQVCSSRYIQQPWIDMVFAEYNSSSLSSDDFRITLSFFWQLIAGFCVMSNRTWTETMASFGALHTFSPVAVAKAVIESQAQDALNNQIDLSRLALARDLLSLRQTLRGNGMVSALATNFYLRFSPTNLGSSTTPAMSPRVYNNCSCLNSKGCPHSVSFNDSQGTSVTIPGMIADCLIIDGTLASTFECYYDQICLALLHPSLAKLIEPLATDSNKHFTINSSIELLLNEIMIDNLTSEIQFDLFYSQCNPTYCAYSYTHQFDILFVITTIIGIFGGLSAILRLTASLAARLILRRKNRNVLHNNPIQTIPIKQNIVRAFRDRLPRLLNSIRQTIIELNLFEQHKPRTPVNIFRERLLTRLFIVLIIICSVVTGFYIFIVAQNQLVTIPHPSLTTYQRLYDDHSDTLQCPCSQVAVPYSSFLNVTFILHQICSSSIISPEWLNYVASFDPILLPSWAVPDDFRATGASYFQLLATFCSLAESNIDNAQQIFMNTRFINDHVLAPLFFAQQTQALIKSYISSTRSDFERTINWVKVASITSHLFTAANTNFYVTMSNNGVLTIRAKAYPTSSTITHDVISSIGSCVCEIESYDCAGTNLIITNGTNLREFLQIFSELPIGCVPLSGFLRSTFDWWYDETYLKNIQAAYTIVIHSQPLPNITSLDTSVSTRFENNQMEYLLQELFIESSINNDTHFDQFYDQCAPVSCSYTIARRRDIIVLLLLIISICGGLNKVLRILVPWIGQCIFFLIDWWKDRHVQHVTPSITARLNHLFRSVYKSIINTNLYKATLDDDISIRAQQKIYTRIYVITFASCLGLLLFYTAIIERNITRRHMSPSMMTYEHLVDLYKNDVSCPCTAISIPYGQFITQLHVTAFHQACSTNVIYNVLEYGSPYPPDTSFLDKDFRNIIHSFVNVLQQLCTLSQETVDNSIMTFNTSTMFINQIISRIQFNNEMNGTLDRFQKMIPIEFARTLNMIRTILQGNALLTQLPSNWQMTVAEKGKGRNTTFRSEPVHYTNTEQNTSCSCATLQTCTTPAQLLNRSGTPFYTLENMILGCSSLETVLLSSLSCFYSMTCITNYRQQTILKYSDLLKYRDRTGAVVQLNISLTRFNINDTVETLAQEMFIESWTSNVSYERFFNSCAPNYCTYKYYYRFDALELLTTFLSVYAGLSLGIRIIVPYLTQIIQIIWNRFRVTPQQ